MKITWLAKIKHAHKITKQNKNKQEKIKNNSMSCEFQTVT